MKIVRSMAAMDPKPAGVVCDWCGAVHLSGRSRGQQEVAFRTKALIGGDGSRIAADICGGCADQQSRRPNAALGRLISDASSAKRKDYPVYRYAAFDIDSDQIVRVQSLLPMSEAEP